jgi:CBS domain-containing protein
MLGMLVRDIMTKNPEALSLNTPISKVAKEMEELDCGFIPIVQDGEISGIITDRDIAIRAVAAGKDPNTTQAQEIMSTKSHCVQERDEIEVAAKKMCDLKVRRLIVLDENKHICGVVSLGDIATKCKDHKLDAEIIEYVSETAGH